MSGGRGRSVVDEGQHRHERLGQPLFKRHVAGAGQRHRAHVRYRARIVGCVRHWNHLVGRAPQQQRGRVDAAKNGQRIFEHGLAHAREQPAVGDEPEGL